MPGKTSQEAEELEHKLRISADAIIKAAQRKKIEQAAQAQPAPAPTRRRTVTVRRKPQPEPVEDAPRRTKRTASKYPLPWGVDPATSRLMDAKGNLIPTRGLMAERLARIVNQHAKIQHFARIMRGVFNKLEESL